MPSRAARSKTPTPEPDQPAVVSPEPVTYDGPTLAAGMDAAERAHAAQTPTPNAAAVISEPSTGSREKITKP